MAGTDGDGQGINLGLGHKISSFSRIGQQLIFGELTFETMAVLGFAFTGFKGTKATQFTFNAHADGMGNVHHFLGDVDVVVVTRRSLGISLKRAVHHHGGKTVSGRSEASCGAIAMVLVHHDRDVGIGLNSRQDQMTQEILACISTSST